VLTDIAEYVANCKISSNEAFNTARYALIDAIGMPIFCAK
jgi:2-methylcitrate dehydratase PrpD